MSTEATLDASSLIDLTAGLASAYLANNSVQTADLPGLIASIHTALVGLGRPAPQPEAAKPTPHISIKKTVTDDYLISLEDGRQYKTLRRHLTGRGLTPDQYRTKWSLPRDYPMVAPNYAKQRSDMARSIGLGQRRKPEPEPAEKPKRGRKKA
ncbi:MucR family transcriptional regulator [uncultured Enterovirga sp.]|uniref:MucR family transcriptional regulator n=1 Tax=uncultured Enterovirga sp. TaxID=2026352 RepID=UPI0035CADB9B